MAKLASKTAAELAAHCQSVAVEIGQAFARAFGQGVTVEADAPGSLDFSQMADDLSGPGLGIVFQVAGEGAAIVLPQKGALLPSWYAAPDATGQSKLTTLAQELGMLTLPEPFLPDECSALASDDLAAMLQNEGVREGAALVRLTLTTSDQAGEAYLIWPMASPRASQPGVPRSHGNATAKDNPANAARSVVGSPSQTAAASTDAAARESGATDAEEPSVGSLYPAAELEELASQVSPATSHPPYRPAPFGISLRDLPPYTRSLLKIRVPLSVTLAAKKQPVGQILEIGPGSIVQFEKSCEEMLDLNVSNLPIARGEAVKVGDKFGLRVTSLILPGERFKPVRPE